MAETSGLNKPWLVAAWPGMGNVGLNAVVYLLAKLEMRMFSELESGDFFDIDDVEVQGGLIQSPQRPRNRIFLWKDPAGRHDLLLLLGEAQPPVGKYAFCRQVISQAKEYGVERVITFAAMATSIHPRQPSRAFGAATSKEGLRDLRRLEAEPLEEGHVGGLNGVLVGAALEAGIEGMFLLGELPQVLLRLVYPKASRAILEVFTRMAGLELDFRELDSQVDELDRRLQIVMDETESPEEFEEFEGKEDGGGTASLPPPTKERLSAKDRAEIDDLFQKATLDRTRAFELKQLLDRLGAFAIYEDRFLDLFRSHES